MKICLDHVGIAVGDVDNARKRWEHLLGTPASKPEELASEGVRLSFVDTGTARIELLESSRPDSAVARFLERRQEGLHHLSFEVDGIDLDAWFDELRHSGLRLLGDGPTAGADGARVFFVHPSSTGGVLLEFSQKRPERQEEPKE